MFKKTVGAPKIESLKDPPLAEKVCKECGALPLLIGAVGRALKFSTDDFWKDALSQLKDSEFDEIDGMDPRVYAGLKFSIEKLAKGERACLLLCSFFPEDSDIDIKMLFDMPTGSQLLGSGRNIGGLVDSLKSSSLLLEARNDDYVKVHDIIKDVARSIARRDPAYAFLSVRCRSRLLDNEEYPYPTRRLLHLDLEGENVCYPDDLVCPDLHTLWVQSNKGMSRQLSSGFFNAFVNVKVLLLQGEFLFDHQLTIHNFKRLRVLILQGCKMGQPFISSVSKNLEILCIRYCDLPSPIDLPELKNLRKLEIFKHYSQTEIVEKAISRLSSLEELIVPYGFKTRADDDKSICWEISQLACLRNLAIPLRKSKLWHFPDRDIFSNLIEFSIEAGPENPYMCVGRKYIRFAKVHIERWWIPLVERAETVELKKVTGLPINGFSDSIMGEAFAKLKEMIIWSCNDMEHVASWEKGRRNQRLQCFTNLTSLLIVDCSSLKYVFSYNVAKGLIQLQTLEVTRCPEIEEIITVEESSDDHDDQQEIICFSNLKTLILSYLPSLTRFCRKKVRLDNITWLDIRDVNNTKDLLEEIERASDHYFYSKLKKLSQSSIQPQLLPPQLKLQLQNLEQLEMKNCWWPGNSLFEGSLTFNTLNVLKVCNNPEISTLFTNSVFRSLHQLQRLEVWNCSLLKEIVEEEYARDDDATNDHNTPPNSFLHLAHISLSNLPNLRNIGISACYMPSLLFVDITGCGRIRSLFTRSSFTNFQKLEKLLVSDCSLLKEIVEEDEDARDDDGTNDHNTAPISLLHLGQLRLCNLPNLQNIGICACYMPTLFRVNVNGCRLITSLFTFSAFRNLLQLRCLEVSQCNLLKEIVEDELDDATPRTSDKLISLLQLTVIKLVNLPRLRSFSSSSTFIFDIPALLDLSPSNCSEWRYSHPITAPLVKIFSDNNKETTDESEGKEEDAEEEKDDEQVMGQATN